MHNTLLFLHSYWAYLVVVVLIVAAVNALIGYFSNREYGAFSFRISLFTLIVAHIQLLLGLILYFVAPYFGMFREVGMGGVMKNATFRFYNVEHPLVMIIAIALITIGYSKHKAKLTSRPKYKTLAIFYTLALILVLSRIPWNMWWS